MTSALGACEASANIVEHDAGRLRLAAKRLDGLPLFALRVTIPGGSSVERSPGQAWLAGRMLGEGTLSRDWRRLSLELESRGLSLSCSAGVESHGLAIDGMADDWRWAVEIAAEMLHTPALDEDRCDWLRQQGMAELESLADQPEVNAGWAFLDQLYHPHPAGRMLQGGREELACLTVDHCRQFHQVALQRGVQLSFAGAADVEEVTKLAGSLFSNVSGDLVEPTLFPQSEVQHPIVGLGMARRRVPVPGDGQSHLFAGNLTVDYCHPDVAALEILGVALGAGAGLAGRLPTRLREVEGLAYVVDVATLAGAGRIPGRLAVYCACRPDRIAEAEAAIRHELESIVTTGLSEREFETGRSYLLGQLAFSRESVRHWCDLLAESLYYRQPVWDLDWRRRQWQALDRQSVTAAIRRHLDGDRLQFTIGEGN